jgi:hypothetical protein
MADPNWNPPPGVWIHPIDGWGFMETIDGNLAPAFEAHIEVEGVSIGSGILGWRGSVATPGHKYAGKHFTMQPRNTAWTDIVVINIGEGKEVVFSGMAETSGLECDWL